MTGQWINRQPADAGPTTPNLIANGSFVGGLSGGWTANGDPPVYDAAVTHTPDGSGSLRIVAGDGPAAHGDWFTVVSLAPFGEGDEIWLSVWAKASAPHPTFTLGYEFFDGPDIDTANDLDGRGTDAVNGGFEIGTDWSEVTIPNPDLPATAAPVVVPAGATHIQIWGSAGELSDGVVWIDDVSLGTPP